MEQTLSIASSNLYPKVSFKKCILHNHENTIRQLALNRQKQMFSNPTIKRCIDMHLKDERHKAISFLTTIVLMKIGTQVVHMNRALMLSAPRNWKSVMFKYIFIPYLMSTYKYVKDIKRTIMEIESVVDEDPQADEMWQPLFERKYPNLNQPLYSSPFKKFRIQDVVRNEGNVKSII